jgi:signal transduction histidine kinase
MSGSRVTEPGTSDRERRALKLERQFIVVRWAAGLFGSLLVWVSYRQPSQPVPPQWLRPLGTISLVILVGGNAAIWLLLRARSRFSIARIGFFAFTIDAMAVFSITWLYSFDKSASVWVALFVIIVEGALRYGMDGALLMLGLAVGLEPLRHSWTAAQYGQKFVLSNVAYELGILGIIAFVTGALSERADRERRLAEARAREVELLNEVVLAGATGLNLTESVRLSVAEMVEELGFDNVAIALVDRESERPSLRFVAAAGFPASILQTTLEFGVGVIGRVIDEGSSVVIGDLAGEFDYVELLPGARSKVCVPIKARDEVIGAIDVESLVEQDFDEADVERLERLAPQMGLIFSNATLLAREQQAVERLRELDQMKSDFIGIASHELRTPLTTLKGFIKTLRRPDMGLTPEQTQDFYATMDNNIDRLIRLVEDLLVTSRLDARAIEVRSEPTDVEQMLLEILAEIGPVASRVVVDVAHGAERLDVDGERLSQIIRNLVENALKFSAGTVTVRARRENGDVAFDVVDEGSGIPSVELEHIFDRFTQVGGTYGRRGPGVGLGLYIARTLSDLIGATITVRSAEGIGTTFSVAVPLGTPAAVLTAP